MSRLAAGGSRRLALQPGLEVWPVFLQFLVVSGNCKELWRERGIALSAPLVPLLGWEVPSWDQEMREWRCNPKATGRYLVLVIGAEAVPGLRVVLSVPAVETEVGVGVGVVLVWVSSLGARTLEPKGTHKVCPPTPAPSILPGDGGVCISQRLRGEGAH